MNDLLFSKPAINDACRKIIHALSFQYVIQNQLNILTTFWNDTQAMARQKTTNWCGQAKRHATQQADLSRRVPLVVILGQTVAKLFDYLPNGPFKSTFMQHSITFFRRLEAANDIISVIVVISHWW